MIESADDFVHLRESQNPDEYHRAAHEEASMEVWYDVIERYPDMKTWVAHNKKIPIEILAFLAEDTDIDVKSSVGQKRKLTVALFEKLARDPDEGVRHRIACNAKAPLHVLRMLSNDPVDFVAERASGRLLDA
jgi:hypothetical protein